MSVSSARWRGLTKPTALFGTRLGYPFGTCKSDLSACSSHLSWAGAAPPGGTGGRRGGAGWLKILEQLFEKRQQDSSPFVWLRIEVHNQNGAISLQLPTFVASNGIIYSHRCQP